MSRFFVLLKFKLVLGLQVAHSVFNLLFVLLLLGIDLLLQKLLLLLMLLLLLLLLILQFLKPLKQSLLLLLLFLKLLVMCLLLLLLKLFVVLLVLLHLLLKLLELLKLCLVMVLKREGSFSGLRQKVAQHVGSCLLLSMLGNDPTQAFVDNRRSSLDFTDVANYPGIHACCFKRPRQV